MGFWSRPRPPVLTHLSPSTSSQRSPQFTLSTSTRSSPSPPPTPKVRPRVFSGSRQPRPRLIANHSYLASASSNAEPDTESETEAEVLGVRVFIEEDIKRSQTPVKAADLHATARAPSPVVERTPPATSAAARRPTFSSLHRAPQRILPAVFTERLHIPFTFSARSPLEVVFDVRRGGEASLLIGALFLAIWRFLQHPKEEGLISLAGGEWSAPVS